MIKFTSDLIDKFADDLLIGLTNEENLTVLNEFEIIEANMNLINEIEGIKEIEPMHFPFQTDVLVRDGSTIENDDIEELLKNSGKISDREIEVPRVI